MTGYVYETDTMHLVAIINGRDNTHVEHIAGNHYDLGEEYGLTYTPSFGCADGLIDNGDALIIG